LIFTLFETKKILELQNSLLDFKYKTPIPIRFSDMDMFGHANNAIFLTYFEQARSNYWNEVIHWDWDAMGIIIAKAEVEYLIPVLLTDELYAYVKTSRIGNSSWDIEYRLVAQQNGQQIIKAKGKTIQVSFDYKLNHSAPIPVKEKMEMITFEGL
jgi:acyl-CoA thioester hydrolase